jgi:hypothetical protein
MLYPPKPRTTRAPTSSMLMRLAFHLICVMSVGVL